MKKWKVIKVITLIVVIIFLIFIGSMVINEFLYGNYYVDYLGCTTFYWYERVSIKIELSLYIFGIPLLIDLIVFIISIMKIKKYRKL